MKNLLTWRFWLKLAVGLLWLAIPVIFHLSDQVFTIWFLIIIIGGGILLNPKERVDWRVIFTLVVFLASAIACYETAKALNLPEIAQIAIPAIIAPIVLCIVTIILLKRR